VLRPIFEGRTIVVMQPYDFVGDPGNWLAEMSERRAVFASTPGFGLDLLAHRIPHEQRATFDLSALRYVDAVPR